MTKRDLVHQLLTDAGPKGVTTSQFLRAGAGSRYGARVQELRDQGLTIHCERVRAGEFRYVLGEVEGGRDNAGKTSLEAVPQNPPAALSPANRRSAWGNKQPPASSSEEPRIAGTSEPTCWSWAQPEGWLELPLSAALSRCPVREERAA